MHRRRTFTVMAPEGFGGPGGFARHGGFGPPGHFGGYGGPHGRQRRRMRRGDVRAAILLLIEEEPRNGYQVMQEIEARSEGAWRPRPGSVYPAFQLLADEGLVRSESRDGGNVFELTDAGRTYVEEHRAELGSPWTLAGEGVPEGVRELGKLLMQVGIAVKQVMHAGGETQAFRKIQDEYQHVNDRHGNPNYMTTSEGWQAGAMDWVKSLGSAGEQASQLLNQTLGQTFSSLTNDIWEATKGTQSWGQSFRDLGDIAGRMLTEILLKMAMIQAINAVLGLFPATAGAGTVSAGASTLGSAGSTMQISSAGGGSFLTHGPTHFTVGDNPGGVELVRVIPLSGIGRTSISGSAAQLAMAGGGVALVAGNAAAAGGGDTFHFTYQFNGGVSREEVLAILPKMVEASKAAVLDAQKRRRDGFR